MNNYEQETRNYLNSLINDREGIGRLITQQPTKEKTDYGNGYLSVLDGAISLIDSLLSEGSLDKDFPETLRETRNTYHQMYLALKKSKDTRFNDGRFRAAKDIDKGIDKIIQSVAESELKKMQKNNLPQFTGDDKVLLLKLMKLSLA